MEPFTGRRVESVESVERAGDYAGPFADTGGGRSVWFLLPIHFGHRLNYGKPCSGLRRVTEPPWHFHEHEDGSVEVTETIAAVKWQGHLTAGHIWVTAS